MTRSVGRHRPSARHSAHSSSSGWRSAAYRLASQLYRSNYAHQAARGAGLYAQNKVGSWISGVPRSFPTLSGSSSNASTTKKRTSSRMSVVAATRSQRLDASSYGGSKYRGKGKILKIKSKKHVKVPKRLRTQINEVVDGKNFHGDYKRIFSYGFNLVPGSGTTHNSQFVVEGTIGGGATGAQWRIGDPTQDIDAFSVLWNAKTPALNYSVTTNNFQTDLGGTKTSFNFKGEILSQKMDLYITNQSHLPLKITAIKCLSRQMRYGTPAVDWANILADEVRAGPLLEAPGPNISSIGTGTPGLRPYDLPAWRRYWKHDVQMIELQPGQHQTISAYGGRRTYDQRKIRNPDASQNANVQFTNVANQTIHYMLIVQPIPMTTTTNLLGWYWPATTATLGVMVHQHYRLLCPEQTLNNNPPAAGFPIAEQKDVSTNKQDAYSVYYANVPDFGGTLLAEVPDTNQQVNV